MRVAVFTDADLDSGSGVATTLGALLRHAPPDVRVRIYTLSDLDVDEPGYLALRSPALPVVLGDGSSIHVPRLRELQRRLVADETAAIHVTTAGPAGLAARLLAGRLRVPLVGSLHHWPLGGSVDKAGRRRPLRFALSWYLEWLYRTCLQVLVPSSDIACRLVEHGWNRDRLAVWPAGVDVEAFSPARRSQRLRSAWHVSDRRPAILWVGPLTPGSGIESLEHIGSVLHRRGIAHRIVVVGDGPARKALENACPDAVFAGRLSQGDLATVMASADLLVAPADVTASGLVVLEAQASGLPAIVTDASSDHVRAGTTGSVCRRDDVLGFAMRAADLLTDFGRRRTMSEAARRFAQSRTWAASLERVYALYRATVTMRALGTPSESRPTPASARALRAHR